MIKTYSLPEHRKWDEVVSSFPNYDVYYLSGYVRAFALHGDGIPMLVYHESDNTGKAICVLMIRDVADDPLFDDKIASAEYHDAVTPYGYGGFIAEGDVDVQVLADELVRALKDMGIISVFFRFHPVLGNAVSMPGVIDMIPLGKTIAINLESADMIWSNITSKNRNMIRKAEKMGVEIKHGKGKELLREFQSIYNETMEHDNAEQYYFFGEEFYDSIDDDLKDGEVIAMSIMIFANGRMNYHLSGSKYEFRNLAPSNLLLYKAALWGMEHGMRTFHLGGGLGSGEDNLYKFKAAFNRNSDYRFAIGKSIISKEKYEQLLNLRGFTEEQITNISYFPQYRAHK